ncbi:MAG: hypothetical protein JWP95_1655 [Actinotalea sp.]|nr:hypothetical protein [Actinotalea sp.]
MTPIARPVVVDATVETGVVRAAGALVWRESAGRLEVALVHRPRYQDWSWPKGKLEPGESVPAAAVREVAEEIGTPVVLGVPLPGLRYRTPDGRGKHVRYWAATVPDPAAPALAAREPVARAPLDEIDDVVWVSTSTAQELLTRAADRAPLAVLEDLWSRQRLATHVLVVARHGQARRRSAHHGDEQTRPLTGTGAAQAAALVPVLSAFGVARVVTSPWERCLRTVTPYADEAGILVQPAEALTEAAHAEDPRAVRALVGRHVAGAEDVLLSTHRPVLPAVLAALSTATRRWTIGHLPATDPYLRPGELLVTHVRGSGDSARLVAIEHHRPSRDRTKDA